MRTGHRTRSPPRPERTTSDSDTSRKGGDGAVGDGLQDDGLREKAGAERGRGEKVADWADGRLGLYSLMRGKARKAFPDHWSFLLGEISLYSFVVVIITGVYLTLFFHPSMNQVEYHGSYAPLRGQLVSEAFDSTMHISFDVRGGLLIRQAHHWAALVFVAAIF